MQFVSSKKVDQICIKTSSICEWGNVKRHKKKSDFWSHTHTHSKLQIKCPYIARLLYLILYTYKESKLGRISNLILKGSSLVEFDQITHFLV